MDDKYIEMVCTGNHGRSPVAELIAQNYLQKIGASNYYVRSSGTLVDTVTANLDISSKLKIIESAKQRKIYSPIELSSIDEAVKTGNSEALSFFYDSAVQKFSEEEHQYRNEALKLFNISGVLKDTKDKTIVRQDNVAVLSMDASNNNRVQKIYATELSKPLIVTLGSLATGNEDVNVPNAFGLSKDAYNQSIEKIVSYVPLAIDKLLQ